MSMDIVPWLPPREFILALLFEGWLPREEVWHGTSTQSSVTSYLQLSATVSSFICTKQHTINIKRGFETKNQKQSGRKTMASTESCFNWKSGRDRNISKKILTSLPIMFPLRNRLKAHTWIFLTESQCHFKQIACYPHKSYSYSATSNRRPSSRQSA